MIRYYFKITILFCLAISIQNLYAKMSRDDQRCQQILNRKRIKLFNRLVKSGRCKTKSFYLAHQNHSPAITTSDAELSGYTTLNELCKKKYHGVIISSGQCIFNPTKYSKEQYKQDAAAFKKLELKMLDKQWSKKTYKQVCQEFKGRYSAGDPGSCSLPRRGGVAAIKKAVGLEASMQLYFSTRNKNKKLEKQAHTKSILNKYIKLPKNQRLKQLFSKTKLIFLPQQHKTWQEARDLCRAKGYELPTSDDFVKHKDDVFGYVQANNSTHHHLVAKVADELDAEMYISTTEDGVSIENGSHWGGNNPVVCKQLTSQEKQALAQKEAQEKQLIKQYTAQSPIDYWQRVVELTNNDNLFLLAKYSARAFSLRLADSIGYFNYSPKQAMWLPANDDTTYKHYHRPRSSNLFEWAFKPGSGATKTFVKHMMGKRMSGAAGLTKQGLKYFVQDLKKEPLFQVLKNKTVTDKKYSAVYSGFFTDKKGKQHRVSIEATPYQFFIKLQ